MLTKQLFLFGKRDTWWRRIRLSETPRFRWRPSIWSKFAGGNSRQRCIARNSKEWLHWIKCFLGTASRSPTKEENRRKDVRTQAPDSEWRGIPGRKICHTSLTRDQERYMRCAICSAKGMHYSDCCTFVSRVREQMTKIHCRFCLDTRHGSDRCRRPRKRCNYCKSDTHHTAPCNLAEHILEYYREYDELREELETFESYYGPSTSGAAEYHECD